MIAFVSLFLFSSLLIQLSLSRPMNFLFFGLPSLSPVSLEVEGE